MNDNIIERLLDNNEKAQRSSDIKFYILSFLLAFMIAMYFLCPVESIISFDAEETENSTINQSIEE